MGYATPIRAPEQVEYRLAENCGCDQSADSQVEYRLAAASDLRWIGSGLAEFGLVAGAVVDPDAARALMDGRDPRTNEQLVSRKKVLDPRGKVVARVVVDAIRESAAADGMTAAEYLGNDRLAARFARAERGIHRDGEGHLLPVADAERLAAAAGLSGDALYGADVIAEATRWKGHHVDVGLRGVDVTGELVKSLSVAFGLADPATAAAMEQDFLDSVNEAVVDVLEPAAAYGMAGHHGDGERAQRVESSGLIGWVTLHRSARPVDASPGDPHLHAHINIAHLVHCEDGKWRVPGAGAEDFHRYARLVNEVAEARFRARLIEKYGARFELSAKGAWELVGVDDGIRNAFSRRHQQIVTLVGRDATREQQKSAARRTAEAKEDVESPAPRQDWRTRAAAHLGGEDAVDRMLAAALPGPDGSVPPLSAGGGPRMPSPAEFAARIWDPEYGLTASRKTVSHTHVLAAVAAAVPYLLSVEQLVRLTDEVLAVDGHAVRLPDSHRHHHAHRRRFTHRTVVEAERIIIESVTTGLDAGLAQLTADAAAMTISATEMANSSGDRVFEFSTEQRAVITRLLSDGHAVDAVEGVAGAGKTTIMAAARAGWEAAGLRVAGTSTAAVAAANLAAEAGIDSQTIAAWTREIGGGGGRGLAGVGVLVIDEAAMVDDRALAALLKHAHTTGTKVVAVGDPLQLRAVGVGGGFKRIHQLVDGLALTENRRQRDVVERAALQDWRDGGRTSALAAFAVHGRVHADDTSTDALTSMLARWNTARTRWAGDPHGQVCDLLLLAARRTDVATLNAGARAVLVATGELEAGRTFATRGDGRIAFATGDLVHIRRNDYRSRRDQSQPDVLNGFRGVVLQVADTDRDQAVLVEWRRPRPGGGHHTQRAWMSATDVAEGRLTHGYALTIASAQGLTSDTTIAYGLHGDSHTLYPAMSRARLESHLHLPLDDLEDDVTRIRRGEVRSDTERLDRAVAAYGRLLENDADDVMVTDELARGDNVLERPEATAARHTARRDSAQAAASVPSQMQAHREAQEAAERSPDAPAMPRTTRDRIQELLEAGYTSRTEPAPESEPASDPEPVAPWTERPFGHIATTHLEPYAQAADKDAANAASKASAFEHQAAALAAVLGTELAPSSVSYDKRVEKLDLAEDLLNRARQAEEKADAISEQIKAMYETNREQDRLERKVRTRAALRRSAITFQRTDLLNSADELAQLITARTEAIGTLNEQKTTLDSDARQMRQQAREIAAQVSTHAVYPATVVKTLADHRAALPALRERLEKTDTDRYAYLTQQAEAQRSKQDKATQKADGLREEAATRTGLTAGQQATETKERTAAAQRARAEQAHANAAASHRAQQYEDANRAHHPPAPDPSRGLEL